MVDKGLYKNIQNLRKQYQFKQTNTVGDQLQSNPGRNVQFHKCLEWTFKGITFLRFLVITTPKYLKVSMTGSESMLMGMNDGESTQKSVDLNQFTVKHEQQPLPVMVRSLVKPVGATLGQPGTVPYCQPRDSFVSSTSAILKPTNWDCW